MALVNIKPVYDYYTKKRVTPLFLSKDELLTMNYAAFKNRVINVVSHLKKIPAVKFNARRSLCLPQSNIVNEAEKQQALKESHRENLPFLLPLQRYTKKQQETARVIEKNLIKKREEVAHCKERIRQASIQNLGNSSVCGNCHLKLGHTKKKCVFSPC